MDLLSLLISAVVGGTVSWSVARFYYLKANRELKARTESLSRRLSSKETLEEFERLLDSAAWEQDYENDEELYICASDPTFQISMQGPRDEFFEDWMQVFPDKNGKAFNLKLQIQGTTIKTLRFVYCDGSRYTVPLPEVFLIDGKQSFVWKKNSLGYKVAEVIGNFYRSETLEDVGKFAKIDVITEQRHA